MLLQHQFALSSLSSPSFPPPPLIPCDEGVSKIRSDTTVTQGVCDQIWPLILECVRSELNVSASEFWFTWGRCGEAASVEAAWG
jgi:hypothetical protein